MKVGRQPEEFKGLKRENFSGIFWRVQDGATVWWGLTTPGAGRPWFMDERRFQTLMNVLTVILLLVLAGSFATVIGAALSAS
ncbi:MAG: hypothetical protein ACREJV_11280 [Candidatus Rokuibacteriota bacterium]